MSKDLHPTQRTKLSQKDLNRILGEHQRFLSRQGGVRAQLKSVNLDGLVLANRDISGADLSGASLKGANLYGSNLTRANLYRADLRDADLRNARLERADLRGASFRGADLAFAAMDHADLRAATMTRVGEEKWNLGASADEATPGTVDFSNCSLRNASFENAKLDNANFSDALLPGARFRGAELANACFRGAILIGVNLADLPGPAEALKDCLTSPPQIVCERAKDLLKRITAHHEWVVSDGKRGGVANIDGEDLRPLADRMKGLCLAGLSARNIIATFVDFSGCQLQAAKFDGADLRGSSFVDADLSGASLNLAKLAHANFRNAMIQDLTLRNGKAIAVQATGAQGLAEQFHDAHMRAGAFLSGLMQISSRGLPG